MSKIYSIKIPTPLVEAIDQYRARDATEEGDEPLGRGRAVQDLLLIALHQRHQWYSRLTEHQRAQLVGQTAPRQTFKHTEPQTQVPFKLRGDVAEKIEKIRFEALRDTGTMPSQRMVICILLIEELGREGCLTPVRREQLEKMLVED